MSRMPINYDYNDDHYEVLKARQNKAVKYKNAFQEFVNIPIGSTVVVQWEDGSPWTNGTIVDKGDASHWQVLEFSGKN